LHPAYTESFTLVPAINALPLDWIGFSPGLTQIGVTPDAAALDSFAFDNETPRHSVYLAPFRLSTRLVTCAEYLDFIDDNGYRCPELWLSEGWETMRSSGWQAPLYWQRDPATPSGWRVYTLHGWQPLDDLIASPVCHLSFFEADAFARWSGLRLPTEFEWEHAATNTAANPHGNLLESGNLHPTSAVATSGLQQLFGDVWEWTQSSYTGYPGYRPLPGALGEYNGKFMSSQMVLRGGSCVTPAAHIRATYRNFFHPSTRWQFSGLRLACDGAI
jgi:ergothioneine biosynthesis protein EgtB